MQTINDQSADFLEYASRMEAAYIVPASKWTQEVLDEINGVGGSKGDLLPWEKTFNQFQMRPGEVTIWGGYNGHGKSQILNQVCAWGIRTQPWLIASMEMPPRKTMKRMLRQVFKAETPEEQRTRDFMSWTDGRLWIYDQTDTVKHDRILGMVHYAAKELKIKHIIIDSLMKCGFRGSKDTISGQQVDFVDRLCWAAKTHNVHIHIVHHMRKGEGIRGEYGIPGKHDFRGAGELVDLVDNAIVIHRNKEKEEATLPDHSDPDAIMKVVKQRHGEWEGQFKFWFHPESQQYCEDQYVRPLEYRV